MFKTNSRFDSLLEIKEQPPKNTKKTQKKNESSKCLLITENNKKQTEQNKNSDNLFSKHNNNLVLNELNFPELFITTLDITKNIVEKSEQQNQEKNSSTSFIDVIKYTKIEEQSETMNELEKEGWIVLKKNKKYVSKQDDCIESVDIHPAIVFEQLAILYEKRRNTYIENWGFDDYTKNFGFNNYNINYDSSYEPYYSEYSEYFDDEIVDQGFNSDS
jgi:hypothetical protein